jgi:hypothetical protein
VKRDGVVRFIPQNEFLSIASKQIKTPRKRGVFLSTDYTDCTDFWGVPRRRKNERLL